MVYIYRFEASLLYEPRTSKIFFAPWSFVSQPMRRCWLSLQYARHLGWFELLSIYAKDDGNLIGVNRNWWAEMSAYPGCLFRKFMIHISFVANLEF